jgi:hypothetical protein
VDVTDIGAVICRGHARTVEEAAAELQAARDAESNASAAWAGATGELANACLTLGNCLRDWQRRAWEGLFSGKLVAVQATGEALRDAYTRSLGVFAQVAEAVAVVEAAGHALANVEEFRRAHEGLRRRHADFTKRWPLFDLAELEEARERARRGEALSAEEFARALLGDD